MRGPVSAAPFEVPIDRPTHHVGWALRLQTASRILAAAVLVLGALVLVGYAVRWRVAVQLWPTLPPMYPNAALALSCGALGALGVHATGPRRTMAFVAAALAGVIGSVELVLNVASARRTWVEALFPDDFVRATTPVAGRPVVETCVALMLLSTSLLLLLTGRAQSWAQALSVAAAGIGLSAVLGYVLGVDRRNFSLVYVGMALHTALGILALAVALTFLRPSTGLLANLLDGGLSGAIIRRLTALMIGTPLGLALVGVALDALLPTRELAQSIYTVLQVAALSCLVLVPSSVVVRTERRLQAQLVASRRAAESRSSIELLVRTITTDLATTDVDVPGWPSAVRYEPATGHLAGDSLQSHARPAPPGAHLVALVDLAGHDAGAAVLAYTVRIHIAALWEAGGTLESIAGSVNELVSRHHTIATGVLLELPHGPGPVRYVNAGHPAPLCVDHRGAHEWRRTGPLFGLAGTQFAAATVDVPVGAIVVLCTDGLEEARPPSGDILGRQRLLDIVRAHADAPAERIVTACLDAALEHSTRRLDDDALVVALRRS